MLSTYRRHKRDCKAEHAQELRTSQFDERKKRWKRCECPIVASGTLSKVAKRQSTGEWEWEPARAVAAAWDRTGHWTATITTPEPVVPNEPQRATIADAVKVFLTNRESAAIAPATLRGGHQRFAAETRG
ncbi:MAG: hypothetical protein ABIZ80_09580 [Bryobacteraceae bacterium]